MGRRKLKMKRIEDKRSRLVTFTKRRSGLFKKARQLSVLCDADIAVVVFSATGKLYESCSGTTKSVERNLSRYQKSMLEEGEKALDGAGKDLVSNKFLQRKGKGFQTCKELLETVDRLVEGNNPDMLSLSDMTQLEQELDASLMQTRLIKTQLMMEHISTLHEKERKLCEQKQELEKQVAAAGTKQNDADEGSGGLNDDVATNLTSTSSSKQKQLVTLPLLF